jgi:hypothetical protein
MRRSPTEPTLVEKALAQVPGFEKIYKTLEQLNNFLPDPAIRCQRPSRIHFMPIVLISRIFVFPQPHFPLYERSLGMSVLGRREKSKNNCKTNKNPIPETVHDGRKNLIQVPGDGPNIWQADGHRFPPGTSDAWPITGLILRTRNLPHWLISKSFHRPRFGRRRSFCCQGTVDTCATDTPMNH